MCSLVFNSWIVIVILKFHTKYQSILIYIKNIINLFPSSDFSHYTNRSNEKFKI